MLPDTMHSNLLKMLRRHLDNVHFFKKGAVMEDLDISDHALVYCCGHFPDRGDSNMHGSSIGKGVSGSLFTYFFTFLRVNFSRIFSVFTCEFFT